MLAKGYVRIHICGGAYERFLNLCANHQITLWEIRTVEKGYEMNLALKDFYRLKPLARKCRTRIRIRRKYGLPFFLNRHRKRKVFVLGFCCCGFFIFLLSCFIWNIQIEGNQEVTRADLMEYLTEQHADYGTWKKDLDCKQMASDIRKRFSEVTWVSVKIRGTSLIIDLQENTDTKLYEGRDYPDSDLVSEYAGEIVEMITRSGTPVVKKGDLVDAGQTLVLGRMEITDDSDEVVACKYCAADADIYIRTEIPYRDEFDRAYEKLSYTGKQRFGGYLTIFGKNFGLEPPVWFLEQYDLLEREYPFRIRDDFFLPLSFSLITANEYRRELFLYTEEEAEKLAESRLHKFLTENEEKGVQIFEKNVKITVSATSCLAEGTITVVQKAGRRVDTEYLELQQESNAS